MNYIIRKRYRRTYNLYVGSLFENRTRQKESANNSCNEHSHTAILKESNKQTNGNEQATTFHVNYRTR